MGPIYSKSIGSPTFGTSLCLLASWPFLLQTAYSSAGLRFSPASPPIHRNYYLLFRVRLNDGVATLTEETRIFEIISTQLLQGKRSSRCEARETRNLPSINPESILTDNNSELPLPYYSGQGPTTHLSRHLEHPRTSAFLRSCRMHCTLLPIDFSK